MAKQTSEGTPGPAPDGSAGGKLARLTAAWAAALEGLMAARVGFLALCDEPASAGPLREAAERRWRDAEEAESAAAAAVLAVWTGGSGDADAVADESDADVDPAAALTFWKRADWAGYCAWAEGRQAGPGRAKGG